MDTRYNENGNMVSNSETEYDSAGNCIKFIFYEYDSAGNLTVIIEHEYDSAGRIIKTTSCETFFEAREFEFGTAAVGDILFVEEYHDSAGKRIRIIRYARNAAGLMYGRSETLFNSEESVEKKTVYFYDNAENITGWCEYVYDSNGGCVQTYYDANGNVIS